MVRKIVLSLIAVLGVCAFALAQNRQVSGTVTGPDGAPIAGASVIVDGTHVGTTTNADGSFAIQAPANGTLAVSFIGYETQNVAIGNRTSVAVKLAEDTQKIDDVIVVAFGTAKKEAFTGSAGVVKADELVDRQSSNVTQALSGRVAGLQVSSSNGQPGSTASLRIRGIGSFSAESEPLFVVDGSPFDGNLSNINPQDIESMTVLKDAASNALYGARGANGVVIITTKKGSKSKEAVVTFDMKIGVNTRSKYANYDVIKDPATYYETAFSAFKNRGYADDFCEALVVDNYNYGVGLGYNVYNYPAGESMFVNGKINPNATLGRVDMNAMTGAKNMLLPDDWADAAYKNGVRQDYNVSVSGSTDRSDNYFSFGYTNDDGYVVGSSFERYTARFRTDFQAKKWLKVGANAGYSRSSQQGVNADASSSANIFLLTNMIAPIYPLYVRDEEGAIRQDSYGNTLYDYGNFELGNYYMVNDYEVVGGSRPFMGQSNPISDNILNENSSVGNALNATGYATVTFLKDFNFTFNAGTDVADSRATNYTNPYFGQYAGSNGQLSKTHTRSFSLNLQQLLTYAKQFGQHSVDVLLGHENYNRTYEYLSGSKVNMFDYANRELSTAVRNPSTNSYNTLYNTEGYFVSAKYDYASKYFVSAAYRRDASSRFHPDHRWGNFWSVGAAWLISKENFMQKATWIDYLKLKASYGSQGNDGIGSYSYIDTYEVVNSAGQPAASFITKGNPNITWETNYNFNVGAEFSFWRGRLSGSVEYFSRKTEDLLFNRPVPSTLGYSSYPDNVGSMRNRGIEIDLNANIFQTKHVNWSVYLNATHYKNKVLSLPPEKQNGYATGKYYWSIGGSRYDWYMPTYAGVDETSGKALFYKDVLDAEGNIVDRTTTDIYSNATQYNLGSALPDMYGGFGTTVEFYGVDFSIGFSYQIGGTSYDSGYETLMHNYSSSTGFNWHKDMLNAWTPDNKSSNIPMMAYGSNYAYANSSSDRFLIDASYISLNNISVGYTLPKKWVSKIGLQKLRIYFAADNVALWSKRKGFDPRQSWNGTSSAQNYAPIRTLSGGLTLQF